MGDCRLGTLLNTEQPGYSTQVIPGQHRSTEDDHQTTRHDAADPRLQRTLGTDRWYPSLTSHLVRCGARFRMPVFLSAFHGRRPSPTRSTLGETVPDSRRSPAPVKLLLMIFPVSRPRRMMSCRTTRWMITSPPSMLNFSSDSE